METIALTDVKVFYDQNHQPREVLMSYDIFQKIAGLLNLKTNTLDQNYFWSESWQSRIREAEADIEGGHVKEATAETIDSVLEWLDE